MGSLYSIRLLYSVYSPVCTVLISLLRTLSRECHLCLAVRDEMDSYGASLLEVEGFWLKHDVGG